MIQLVRDSVLSVTTSPILEPTLPLHHPFPSQSAGGPDREEWTLQGPWTLIPWALGLPHWADLQGLDLCQGSLRAWAGVHWFCQGRGKAKELSNRLRCLKRERMLLRR